MNTLASKVEWKPNEDGQLAPHYRDDPSITVAWAPLPGSQEAFLSCPYTEVLFEGARGPGKTDALLADFMQFVDRGFGRQWRGICFRRHKVDLTDLIEKSLQLIPRIFPAARYNENSKTWRFPKGESLRFSHFDSFKLHAGYIGHAYTWIGWEELTTWPSDDCFTFMFSCLRSPNPKIPLHVRATTNPHGAGHNWVKRRYQLPVQPGHIFGTVIRDLDEEGEPMPVRVAIHGKLEENIVLLHAQPHYAQNISGSTTNVQRRKAWRYGDWDIVSGGIFDDLWTRTVHVIPPIPIDKVPRRWRLDRAFDSGRAKPFSIGWWAQSNGEEFEWAGRVHGRIKGDLFRIAEWYGCKEGEENVGLNLPARAIAKEIKRREKEWGVFGKVQPGPADTSIWTGTEAQPALSVASEMELEHITWESANKGPGSRENGWQLIRDRLAGAIGNEEGLRENPGIYICSNCVDTLRLFPITQRSETKVDDIDTESEDHIADEIRYRVTYLVEMTGMERNEGYVRGMKSFLRRGFLR